ncbi:HNH endonuclease [Pleomorphomonas oryzae]|uniref:HNH endonuclease n=1 Tax=Pleomorphomonas oryzae TaxID=261934 RepID=UPI00040491D0|nr:hypothetical protein [Pleomorphomonas oryzae]
MPPLFRPSGSRTKAQRDREADQRRGSARERGYTTRWDKARKGYLLSHPLCAYCEAEGQVTPATLVDHLYPQQTYPETFWETDWWVPCCKPCHDGPKQRAEREGKAAIDALAKRLGRPLL